MLQKQGNSPAPVGELTILGGDVSGVIAQLSEDMSSVHVSTGYCVCGIVAGGGYAQFVKVLCIAPFLFIYF